MKKQHVYMRNNDDFAIKQVDEVMKKQIIKKVEKLENWLQQIN